MVSKIDYFSPTMIFSYSSFLLYGIIIYSISLIIIIIGLIVGLEGKIFLFIWQFFPSRSLDNDFPLVIDAQGVIFRSVVFFISANIFMFSSFYIEIEVFVRRFIFLVIAFIGSINFIIFIPHFIGLLLGWDGLGLVSFLLVIYFLH